MALMEEIYVKILRKVLAGKISIDEETVISSDGLEEILDIPYMNRVGKELKMDIFKPIVEEGVELPVIVNIHGGGLIEGDKKLSAGFCRMLAKKGYIVFSLEYRLIPNVKVYEQIDDVCAGMDCVGRKLIDFDVDITRIYLTAESAGAYLATYVVAMKYSKALQDAIGYEPARMNFKAIGLMSGMFYTRRKDSIGIFMSRLIYGHDEKSKAIGKYLNPENKEIIYNIPPVYLITSKADFLERYTLDFAGELGNKSIEHKLRHMGRYDDLVHAFPVLRPGLVESQKCVDELDEWFKNHTDKFYPYNSEERK